MARIRTIKPEFFRHEQLQDAEIANPGAYVMLVFAGLWGHCDSKGRFEWRPRQLKLDILPFLDFQMAKTLEILCDIGMVKHYTIDGKEYGEIASFEKHQRITGKEATEGEKHPSSKKESPENNETDEGKHRGNNGETPENSRSFTNVQEGKGKEEEGKGGVGEGESPPESFPADAAASPRPPNAKPPSAKGTRLPADWVLPKVWGDWAVSEFGLPAERVRLAGERFADFWHAKAGRDAAKLDWQATWRNWIREDVSRSPPPATAAGPSGIFAGAL